MAVKKYRDHQEYQGNRGKLKRFFEQKVDSKSFKEPISLKEKMETDFTQGLFWNVTGGEGNAMLSMVGGMGIFFSSMLMGVGYLSSPDAVEVSRMDPAHLTVAAADLKIKNDGAVIISRGEHEMPFLLKREGDRVFMYEDNGPHFMQYLDDASELLDFARMEWTLLSPPDAYEAIQEIDATLGHYDGVSSNQQVAFFNQVAPITQYSAKLFSPDYAEGEHTRISTENHVQPEISMDVSYVQGLSDDIDSFIWDMTNNRYGYAENLAPQFDHGDFYEAGLDPASTWWFGTFFPIFLIGGVGIGTARAGTSMVRAAASGGSRRKSLKL
jgi:hypothetical protein